MARFSTIKIDITQTNVFFTSDNHFMHKNIIEYCDRPFDSLEEMEKEMIDRWNSVVGEKDIIFHLGDFSFGGKQHWKHKLDRLNGQKYLAVGNHDKSITPNKFVDVEYIFNLLIRGDEEIPNGQRISVCHYPMLSWYHSHKGAWQLFGHVHGGLADKGMNRSGLTANQLDVGVDAHDFYPISYQQVKTLITRQNLNHEK
jgi:calcineurin-like phosphoesterase family protein